MYENIVTVRIIYIGDYLLRIIYIYAGNGMGAKLVNINLRHQWRIQTFGGGGGGGHPDPDIRGGRCFPVGSQLKIRGEPGSLPWIRR